LNFSERRDIVLPLDFYPEPHELLRNRDDFGKLTFVRGKLALIDIVQTEA
jgi:hypothetical protein